MTKQRWKLSLSRFEDLDSRIFNELRSSGKR